MHRTPSERRIGELALKRLDGNLTPGEEEELAAWLAADDNRPLELQPGFAPGREQLGRRLWRRIDRQTRPRARIITPARWMAAASVLLVLAAAWAYWALPENGPEEARATWQGQAHAGARNHIQHLQLPDGSTVVLQALSTLDYVFEGGQRSVSLVGEAFFDIAHDEVHPFIIHTGKLRTTVLGTSFNIKAYPGQPEIVVSVTRGKVKVEDEERLLAELGTDEQVRYFAPRRKAVKEVVAAEALVTDWTRQDMVFEDITFRQVAEILERRYDVEIRFAHPEVGRCPVRASFNGTEPLERVIKILCNVLGDHYTLVDQDIYLIDGEPCH